MLIYTGAVIRAKQDTKPGIHKLPGKLSNLWLQV